MSCAVMVILDITIVNVALPSIHRDLGFAQENLQWVITAYTIMLGGTLLLGGRLADLLGRRRLLLVGPALFSSARCSVGSLGRPRASRTSGRSTIVPMTPGGGREEVPAPLGLRRVTPEAAVT
jgi:MFS family permease